ncbi:helix-turn-helix domain-containing protein [Enterococcus camelliae]|uniref:Helix-turn-helix domain-containing protein n=1 Tax=Enterococcus camelliae TaxID=453959 RepID=A0ABW5TKG5_9ENTE
MTHTEHATQSRKEKHLSFDERQFIAYLKNKLGLSNRTITKELGRAPQTIHNEIKDGTDDVIKQRQIHGTKQLITARRTILLKLGKKLRILRD